LFFMMLDGRLLFYVFVVCYSVVFFFALVCFPGVFLRGLSSPTAVSLQEPSPWGSGGRLAVLQLAMFSYGCFGWLVAVRCLRVGVTAGTHGHSTCGVAL